MHGRPILAPNQRKWRFPDGPWCVIPHGDATATISASRGFPFDTRSIASVTELLANDDEPVAHSVWQEAWHVRTSSPRSALVVGMSALEVGFKEMVADLVPDAAWLAMNAPTPPLLQMITEFMRELPTRKDFDPALAPAETLGLIRKAISERNRVAHQGKEVDLHKLEDILQAVRRLLWAFDYCRGHEWALDRMREEAAGHFIDPPR